MTVTIERVGNDEKSLTDVFELLILQHRECGYTPLNFDKAIEGCYHVLTEGMTFVARDEDGKAVGTIGLREIPIWYGDDSLLQDSWVFVHPDWRKPDLNIGTMLLHAARDEAIARNKMVFVTVNNPDRRPKKTKMSLVSQIAGFVPLGYTIKLN